MTHQTAIHIERRKKEKKRKKESIIPIEDSPSKDVAVQTKNRMSIFSQKKEKRKQK